MALKYANSPAGQKKVHKVLHEFATKKLRTPNGKTVTDRKQAIAIALSEARRVEGQ